MSRTTRSTWRRPFFGGRYRSMRSVTRSSPTLSLLRIAEKARTLASSAARSRLLKAAEPKFPEALISTSNRIVSSRSSVNFLTKGRPARAVTFQSMVRTSSPGLYSRTSSKSMPRPLNTEWYSPARLSLTMRRVRISNCRMPLMMALVDLVVSAGMRSGHGESVEDLANHVLGADVFGLGFVSHGYTVAQHIHGDRLDVLRRDVVAAIQKSGGARSERQVDRRPRRSAGVDIPVDVQGLCDRRTRGEHEVHDVVPDLVVHVQRVDDMAGVQGLFGNYDGAHSYAGRRRRHRVQDGALFVTAGVGDDDLH